MGAQLLDGVALGGNLSPHTLFQEGLELSRRPDPARMAFASSQRAPPRMSNREPSRSRPRR